MNLLHTALEPMRTLAAALGPSPAFELKGRVALITGGGDGIGMALARELRAGGMRLALIDIDDGKVAMAATELGGETLGIAADVRDRAAMAVHVQRVTEHFGRLDLVIANAGVAPAPVTVRTISPEEFDRIVDVNLTGVLNTVKPAIETIIENRGHIVLVASCAAFMPGMGMAPYMVSKAGVEQLGRALRIELAPHGASAGVAYFGFVQTEFARPLDEDELARKFDAHIPYLLRRRISPEFAATQVIEGITRRAGAVITPGIWTPIAWMRGMIAGPTDRYLTGDPWIHSMIRAIERRHAGETAAAARHLREAQ
ncbi:short-chain dehydrogenase/reductase [Nocardia huaxiensis]|uniref:short-chain dehydrogenase/reductase n=1 Tax=Nocardia huaxiensis TaxID=2755382 RepID=UPI001E41F230|nr:short-chain dehydrogenase/reductase [Nocardia huaxiensis]UFS98518.1 short-chain dehydrogenase/reductase [Nocardia huaxiensis]